MSFSLRTIFAAVTVLAVLVAAFFSGNWVFLSLCSLGLFIFMLASLPLALLTESKRKSMFFITFSIVSIGIFLASGYFSAVDTLASKVASMREVQVPIPAYRVIPNPLTPIPSNTKPISLPGPFSGVLPIVASPNPIGIAPTYTSNVNELRELKKLVALLIACITGAVVGCAISRLTPSGSQTVAKATPSVRKAE
ncbi:hypothetical protein N9061_00605 [bacterium]|nr:hypothetical protein [bacterium]